jgi:uncharacterized protein YrrD
MPTEKPSDIVKQSDLLHQLILDRHTMAELGQVEVLWMYPKVHRVLGFISKSGWLGSQKAAFNLDQLHTVGAKSILVNSQPLETDAEKVRQLESLVNCEVWTEAGNQIGKIIDYLFHLRTGEIPAYLFVSNGWGGITGTVYKLPPDQILNIGHRRVLVAASAVSALEIYRAGIQAKITKATELIKEEKTQVAAGLRSLLQQAKTATEIAKERAQILAEQAKEKAQTLNEQLLETTYMITEELVDRTPPVTPTNDIDYVWDEDWSAPPPAPTPPTTPPTMPAPRPTSPPVSADSNLADVWDDEPETAPSQPRPSTQPPPPKATPRDNDDDEPWI